MRVLVGISVANEISGPLLKLAETPLFKNNMRLSRMEPHITLKAPQQVNDVKTWQAQAERACRSADSFVVRTTHIGFLTPFTFCIFLDSPELCRLQYRLADALAKHNDPDIGLYERELFRPHITIGRTAVILDKDQRSEFENLAKQFFSELEFGADSIRLYGQTKPPDYSTLADIALNDN